MRDQFGLEIDATAEVTEQFNHFANEIIQFGCDGEQILQHADNNPASAILQLCAASFYLFSQEPPITALAQKHLNRLENRALTAREQAYLQLINAWQRNDYATAIEIGLNAMNDLGQDLLLLSMMQFLFFCGGQYYYGQTFKQLCDSVAHYHQGNPYFLSMQAFAHQLSNEHQQGINLAQQALSIESNLPWAQHCLAHAYSNLGNYKQALAEFEPHATSWNQFCRPIASHNFWHLALLKLHQLDYDGVIDLYDQQLANTNFSLIAELVDCIALLWRLDLVGYDCSPQWQQLLPHVIKHENNYISIFNSAHFIYALARNQNYSSCEQYIESIPADSVLWSNTGKCLLNAIVNYSQQNYAECSRLLEPLAQKQIYAIGGSDAQCELFLLMYIQAVTKQDKAKAQRFFKHLTRFKSHHSPFELSLL